MCFSSLLVVYEGYDCCPTENDPYNADHRVVEGEYLDYDLK